MKNSRTKKKNKPDIFGDLMYIDSQLNQIDSNQNIVSCPIQNQILNTTWKSISKLSQSKQATSLTIIRLFDCNYIHSIQCYSISYNLSPNIQKFLNINHILNTPISPCYLLMNAHLCHIEPTFHNYCLIYVTLPFIPQASR